MKLVRILSLIATIALFAFATGCKKSGDQPATDGTHTHADGSTHDDHAEGTGDEGDAAHEEGAENEGEDQEGEDHAHDETSLGTTMIGEHEVELAQGHGAVAAGMEGHLVVKLPYSDNGATVVRAWIGTEDRTLSLVGKGEYASSHDDYDIHAMAPDPLPENTLWWIEIEKPDGTKIVGSMTPIMN